MGKRSTAILSALVVFLLIVVSILLYRNYSFKSVNKPDDTSAITTAEKSKADNEEKSATNRNAAKEDKSTEAIRSEEIKVINNSPEYDLKASLYENSINETYIKFEYYIDGTGITKELGNDKLTELKDLFKNRAKSLENESGNRIKNIYFNPKKSKAYFMLEGNNFSGETATTLYFFNLKDFSTKKLFEGTGKYSEPIFTKDFKYMAFNYTVGIAPQSSKKKSSYFQVINCDADELIINNSRDVKGDSIGGKKGNDYYFLSWASNTSVRLMENMYMLDKIGTDAGVKDQKELLYDIEKNMFLNPDGSIVTDGKTSLTSTSGAARVKTESDSIKALRNYYLYMSSEQYGKANELLDDKFTLKLKMFKQFGIDALTKSDMDVSNMALYGSLFKTAKIESIVSEKAIGSNSVIYFYIVYSMGESDQVKQPLIANLVKMGKIWKILTVTDGNSAESPFKK